LILLNTGWYNPVTELFTLTILMVLTMLIECSLIAFYSWRKKYSLSGSILLIIVTLTANLLSGVVGFLLQWVI